jgi:PAS domain S-box-containing protein
LSPRYHAPEGEVNLPDLLESTPTVSIIDIDRHGRVCLWNKGAENLLGYTAGEMVGHRWLDSPTTGGDGAMPDAIREMIETLLTAKKSVSCDVAARRKDGRKIRVQLRAVPRFDAGGNVKGVLVIGEDISEHAAAREAALQAERELRLLAFTLNCAKDAFVITDLDNTILYVNQSFLDTYGYAEEELIGRNITLLRSHSVPRELTAEIRATTRTGGWSGEIVNRRKDGSEFPVELWTSVVRNDAGEPVALVGVAREITERKIAEERIRATLKEKDVLLKEIHHRVKNNLQVITSLLNLQATKVDDPATFAALKESQNRVRSMALVHEELYRSRDLARIEFGDYIRRLTDTLLHAYRSTDTRIAFQVEVGSVFLPVDTAIPCGLIINELVANAFKYAFTGRTEGAVAVLFAHRDHGYVLEVRDDGVGFPEDLDFRTVDSLGLQLVVTLTNQLRGTITMQRTGGTVFTVEFPEETRD